MTDSPASQPELSVVIPLYNEADSVAELQREVAAAVGNLDYELILVDDGSSDTTVDNITRNEQTRIIQLAQNTGQSAAMYTGIMAAEGKYIALLDGDLQNNPRDIAKLLEQNRAGFDLACGYRANRKDTAFKRLQSKIANAVRSKFTGDGVRDTGCTLKTMRRECRTALVPFTGMHRFLPALIKGAGYSITELPVNHRARKHGTSKYTFGNRAIVATSDMFAVRWWLTRRFSVDAKEISEQNSQP